MLYDQVKSGDAVLPDGFHHEDLAEFLKIYGLSFFAMGSPEDWDDKSCFRVSSPDGHGYSINFTKVTEWLAAKTLRGAPERGGYVLNSQGVYYSFKNIATSLHEVRTDVILVDSKGAYFTIPLQIFEGYTEIQGKIYPRYREVRAGGHTPLEISDAPAIPANYPIVERVTA